MFLDAVFYVLQALLDLAWWAVILAVIMQLLLQFNVLDTRNRIVWTIADLLYRVTDPLFRRVRRVLPNFGPLDLSPVVVLIAITAIGILLGATRRYLVVNGLYF
ncbi:YggT family protein [Plastoroseomonas arctica]|uniref:YggT family protein n=1 Tax=Plastoroseomonas arctica TaxID=1509237 RepID=A0AAF1JWC0_9PROT|nr:YggT family protein [Plastoroseomonas arctica]MBR0654128.1 YggT family protein [Plastoroseomonas arctica]